MSDQPCGCRVTMRDDLDIEDFLPGHDGPHQYTIIYCDTHAAAPRLEQELRDVENAAEKQVQELTHQNADLLVALEMMTNAIRTYLVAIGRAPNNRDQAEIDAAAIAMFDALTPGDATIAKAKGEG